jgi:ribosomal protein S18 acetylase RimI-like enzyme
MSRGDVAVRLAGVGDAAALAPLFRAEAIEEAKLDSEHSVIEGADWLEYVRQELSRPGSRVFAAEARGGQVIGFVHARLHAGPARPRRKPWPVRRRAVVEGELATRNGQWGSIEHVYVVETERRKGAAAALLAAALEWLAEAGAVSVDAGVAAGNQASVALFGSHGFEAARTVFRRRV